MEKVNLNTKDHCVLCLRKYFPTEEIKPQEFNFYPLCPYLKISLSSAILEKLNFILNQGKSSLENWNASKVEILGKLCLNCGKLCETINRLFFNLNPNPLNIEYNLGKLEGVIEETNKNSYRVGQFKQSMRKGNKTVGYLEIVEEFRSLILQKCKARTSLMKFPKVVLRKLDLASIKREMKSRKLLATEENISPISELQEIGPHKPRRNTPLAIQCARWRNINERYRRKLGPNKWTCKMCPEKIFKNRQTFRGHYMSVHLNRTKKNTPRLVQRMHWENLYESYCKQTGPSQWACTLCYGSTFTFKKSFQNHYNAFHLNRTYNCGKGQCPMKYKDMSTLRRHRMRCKGLLEKPPGKYECQDCGQRFGNTMYLFKHRSSMHPRQPRSDACPFCPKRFKTNHGIKMHCEAVHFKIRHSCKEPGCDRSFIGKEYLKLHIAKCHILNRKVETQITSEEFDDGPPKLSPPSPLSPTQIPENSQIEPPILCPFYLEEVVPNFDVDEFIFVKEEAFQEEEEQEEIDRNDEDDDWTPNMPKRRTKSSDHSRGKNPFDHAEMCNGKIKCKLCGNAYSHRGGFSDHFKKAHLRIRFPCKIGQCQGTFVTKRVLRLHQEKCKGQPPKEKLAEYPCKLCSATFSEEKYLTYHHKIVHLRIRKYPCDLCEKKFHKPCLLKQHKDTVHFKMRIKCIYQGCDKAYSTKSRMDLHVARDHLKVQL